MTARSYAARTAHLRLREFEDAPNDPPGYARRVRELEAEGMTTSDAQGCADVEFGLLPQLTKGK
jgi:hypothetical protein